MNKVKAKITKMLTCAVFGVGLLSCAVAANANPIAAPGTEGFKVIVTGTSDVIATYLGTTAAYSDDLLLGGNFIFNNHASVVGSTVNLGSFAVGTELVFELYVHDTGNHFFSGPASRNPDSHAHARVQSGWATDTTLVSFEDLYDGPFNFNDLSFSFTNTTSKPPVPEPNPFLLMLAGLGLVGMMLRARRAKA